MGVKIERLGEEHYNKQGCLMRIVEYVGNDDITVEFQDEYKAKVHTTYCNFQKGGVKNPYYPSVYGVGMIGEKYLCSDSNSEKWHTKEYEVWKNVLQRCFYEKKKKTLPTYQKATCCEDWLLYDNFYEWLHSQENFDRWLNGDKWAIDKDIIIKGNKLYSPDTCCLVPNNVNVLFTKRDNYRGNLPIGVKRNTRGFQANCENQLLGHRQYLGTYSTPDKAFNVYKEYKEGLIKQVAQEEYVQGNITKECYEAMLRYEVEITD